MPDPAVFPHAPQSARNVRSFGRSPWPRRLATAASIAYMVAVSAYLLSHGAWPTPDFIIPPLILIALFSGRGWSFVIDWAPFLAILLAYEAFRGIADDLNSRVHVYELINADRRLAGGVVPTVWLQEHFFRPDRVAWYDWVATALHATHFAVAVVFGFGLWMVNRSTYWRFAAAMLGLFGAGIVTQYFYPAAPPWLAADLGVLPPVTRILGPTLIHLSRGPGFSLAYQEFSPNPVAAMPSLHAGLPLLIALIAIDLKGLKVAPILLYPLVGAVAWVYLGEHYVIDVLAGWLYAVDAFVLIWLLGPRMLRFATSGRRTSRSLERLRNLRPLPAWPLGAGVGALILYVWFNPIVHAPLAPLAPLAAVEPAAGSNELTLQELQPVPCRDGRAAGSFADGVIGRYAQEYAGFIQGLHSDSCLVLTAERDFDPLSARELRRLNDLQDLPSPSLSTVLPDGKIYMTVGIPSSQLTAIDGIDPEDLYAVVLRVNDSDHDEELEDLARQIGQVVFN